MKGYQRKIVCVKNTDSPIIEEAYFILYKDVSLDSGRQDFIKEADRIIEEGTKRRRNSDGRILSFILGAVCALAVTLSVIFLTRVLPL